MTNDQRKYIAALGLASLLISFGGIHQYVFKQEAKKSHDQIPLIGTNSATPKTLRNSDDSITTDSRQGKILLLTYCRSGSTFTSEILQQNPDVYFWFEPFRITLYNEFLVTLNSARKIRTKQDARRLLEDLFNCNLLAIPNYFWRDKFQKYSSKGKFYQNCMTNGEMKNSTLAMKKCLLELQNICKNSKYVLIKTTRILVETVVLLMEKYTDLKIIHLTRDPRGLITSRLHYNFFPKNMTVSEFANNHCNILLKNIKDGKTLENRYPNRSMQLRYETLACDPINFSKILYEFGGFKFTSKIEKTIFSMTGKGKFVRGPMGLVKPDSCQAAHAWKTNIAYETAKDIEKECVPLFKEMNLQNMKPNKTIF